MQKIKRTYITKMPDKAGAFLKASKIISQNGGNIVRVNYNKTVDAHTLFIEVCATQAEHEKISVLLNGLGYLSQDVSNQQAILIVLKLPDVVGAVTPVLEIINSYNINVSYISAQENGTPYQYFKMGLIVENANEIKSLLEEISAVCEVKVLDYNVTEKSLDNTVFYISFANEMREVLGLNQDQVSEIIINSNRIMQTLDERNETPLKTFDYIRQFALFVVNQKGENFDCNIAVKPLSKSTTLYIIEPPCGSNTYVLKTNSELFFIDCGFACYRKEMTDILERLFGNITNYKKTGILTHADIDHAGLCNIFDKLYLTQSCYDNFSLELEGKPNFREQNPLHAPYCELSKIISEYETPRLDKATVIGEKKDDKLLSKIGGFTFEDLDFDVYEGIGGHVKGETVIVNERLKIIFTGDIVVNINGFSEKQRVFNLLAPYLMTSVNVDSAKAKAVREELLKRFKGYAFYPGHGAPFFN